MKKGYRDVMNIAVLVIGAALLAYPSFVDKLYMDAQTELANEYEETVEAMEVDNQLAQEMARARAYNDLLTGMGIKDPFVPGSGSIMPDDYETILNINGIMGYLEIPRIKLQLSIRHGSSETVLKQGIGHLENTALPVGGEGTHCVLTAHNGGNSRLFTDIDKLEMGDQFYIRVLGETLAYEVDQFMVVEPSRTDALHPVSGEDFVTLVTCTPYGINSHRLFVRGHRVAWQKDTYAAQADQAHSTFKLRWQYIVSAIAMLISAATLVNSILRRRNK